MDLASYRELESFTQFGSDLDASTKARLDRGKRTQEILKQDLHKTLSMEEEAIILYSLIHGFLDDVEVEKLQSFEDSLYQDLKTDEDGKKIASMIKESKELPKDTAILDNYLNEFKKRFM